MSRRRALGAVLALSLVSACGSTVQVKGTATGDGGLGGPTAAGTLSGESPDNIRVGTGGGSAGSATGAALPGSSTAGGSGRLPSSPASLGASTSGSASGGVTGATGPETGRGFTRTTISVGVATANDYNSFAAGFGLKGVGYQGNPSVWFQAAADDINKHGGLLGRKVVLVPHDFSSAQEVTDTASANQAACTTWTQDKPVFAVLFAGFLVEDTLLTCLGKAGVPLIYPGAGLDYPLHYQQTYERFPLFFNLAQMVGDRFDRIAVERLVARGFFSPWDASGGKPGNATANPTKIGLIGFDDPDGAIQLASEQRQLAAHGLKATKTVQCPRSLQDKISCEQSAELTFASSGITHVFGADTTFMNTSNTQGYHPRYFVAVEPATYAQNESASQLAGSMSEGYIPFTDVGPADYPGDPSAATGACRRLMKSVGQASTDPTTLDLQMSVCEEFNFLRAGVAKAGVLGGDALRHGLEALGSAQPSTLAYESTLGPDNHASATALRDIEYRTDEQQYVYTSVTLYR